MQKEIGTLLKNRIADLPFIDVLAGIAQTVTRTTTTGGAPDGESVETTTTQRFPVSDDHNQDVSIYGPETLLIPNSDRRSIIYFEDYGIGQIEINGRLGYVSSIRLLAWFNRDLLTPGQPYAAISARYMAQLIDHLTAPGPVNISLFQRLMVGVVRIPPADAALFGRYTYDETQRQYLRPPFDFFAIDLEVKYLINKNCLI